MGQACSAWRKNVVEHELEELNAGEMRAALTIAGKYLRKKRHPLTVVAIGGGIATLHLRSRDTTPDFDFFARDLDAHDHQLIRDTSNKATDSMGAPRQWFNSRVSAFLSQNVRYRLVDEAIVANEVVFQHQGLTVLAAPWRYSFCTKLNRMHRGVTNRRYYKPYDISDAIAFLQRLVQQHGGPVPRTNITDWLSEFGFTYDEDIVMQVGDEYQVVHGEIGIVVEVGDEHQVAHNEIGTAVEVI